METLRLIKAMCYKQNDFQVIYASNDDDAIKELGGYLVCGNVEAGNYLIARGQQIEDEYKCNFIIYSYCEYYYAYRIEVEEPF